jgi:NADH-quinone oxidoreductase subunit M
LLSAAYLLWTLQRMFFGAPSFKGGDVWRTALQDINTRETITLLPLAAYGAGAGRYAVAGV